MTALYRFLFARNVTRSRYQSANALLVFASKKKITRRLLREQLRNTRPSTILVA